MGKSSRPLTILLTDSSMALWDEFQTLAAQGHTIRTLDVVLANENITHDVDLVMGSKAHYLINGMEKLVPVALKSARALKLPKPIKETN